MDLGSPNGGQFRGHDDGRKIPAIFHLPLPSYSLNHFGALLDLRTENSRECVGCLKMSTAANLAHVSQVQTTGSNKTPQNSQ